MAIIKQLYNKPLLEDGNPNKLPVYPISVASAIYDKYNTDLQTLIDEGYKYLGIATPTNPEVAPTPYQNCFYLAATEGTYSQFGGVTLEKYQLGIIKFTEGTWTLDVLARFYQIPATGIPFRDIESGVIPENTSDLINDSGFITNTVNNLINYYDKSSTYTKQEIQDLIDSSQGVSIKYVDTLPTASVDTLGSIYLVPAQEPKAANEKDEYITITTTTGYKWETIGSTAISLDGYVTDAELSAALNDYVTISSLNTLLLGKQDKLVSGENIKTINGNSILGSGNITIEAGGTPTWGSITGTLSSQTDLANALAGKQNTISDIETIRSGASAGATAYQKPSTGIPAADLSEAVQESLEKADEALQSETDPTVPAWAKADNPPTEVFWATYGTTTAAEIDAAISAGKAAMCEKDDGTVYYLSYPQTNYGSYYFVAFVNEVEFILAINKSNNAWSTYSRNFALATDRVNTITGNESATNKYPSTKAVADYVASKAEVFVAEYGVTSGSDVVAAYDAGKTVVCFYNNRVYTISTRNQSICYFGSTDNETLHYLYVLLSSNTWGSGSTLVQRVANKVNSWQETPSDLNYPSEKLVKDSLDAIHQIPSGGTSGQVLSKVSGTDYDTEWVTPPSGSSDAVQYTPQTLTDAQKAQARVNIQTLHANFDETITPVTTGAETTQNKAQTLVGNENDTTKYPCTKAVADALGKWGVVSQTQTWTRAADGGYDYTMSDQVYGFIPKANIDLYEAAGVGAVFNENTGYFELNELTDISYEEIRRIYAKSIGGYTFATNRNSQFALYSERTTVQLSNPGGYNTSINHTFQSSAIHIAYLVDCNNLGATLNTFFVASRLKKVIGILNALSWNDKAFGRCFSLESVTISGLRSNISFQDSQRLSLASVVYMVTNSTNTSAITITLHAVAYARCQADTTEYTYNGQTYTGILAYASAKNITIASA